MGNDEGPMELQLADLYQARLLTMHCRIAAMCGDDLSYQEWTKQKFPDIFKGLDEGLPNRLKRAADKGVPFELFDAIVEGAENAHRQCYLLWKYSQAGNPVAFDPPPSQFIQ